MSSDQANPTLHGRAPWLAIIAGLFGLALVVGGAWLAVLGGGWFYVAAGVLLLITAALLWQGRAAALLVYAALIVATLAWALYERGLDWWGLVARGDLFFVLGALLLLPPVTGRLAGARAPRARGALALAAIVGVAAILAGSAGLRLDGRPAGARNPAAATADGVAPGDWSAYGHSWRGDHFSPLGQITPANASGLREAWVFHTRDLKQPQDPDEFTYEVTPIKVGGLLYLCTPHDVVFALDPDSGRQVWRFDPHIHDFKDMQHLTCRGVSYASTPAAASGPGGLCGARILLATNDARLIALDARTGAPCPGFGERRG